ncbi:MAG: hypothetical protein M5U28_37825 [Sandaracinaceae bacterium]|nr:hypothetical protein [Sandaracinaceae bacterium]
MTGALGGSAARGALGGGAVTTSTGALGVGGCTSTSSWAAASAGVERARAARSEIVERIGYLRDPNALDRRGLHRDRRLRAQYPLRRMVR